MSFLDLWHIRPAQSSKYSDNRDKSERLLLSFVTVVKT